MKGLVNVKTLCETHRPKVNLPAVILTGWYVKVCWFGPWGESEKFWVQVKAHVGDKIYGIVCNDLVYCTDYKDGDDIECTVDNVWMILDQNQQEPIRWN